MASRHKGLVRSYKRVKPRRFQERREGPLTCGAAQISFVGSPGRGCLAVVDAAVTCEDSRAHLCAAGRGERVRRANTGTANER